ncbi:uncharacterized protein AC631_00159 [Debaryomyces fabryi]|uniref:Uncharacterized protein n=1 Tax=Debaryomyces fabryi TaxID=58627 RepID=A0A0V1Q6F4_9ASCO|nr:uncharacterized protein AC631_00159 [Debaryomyces fabryi]KSA04080.1 hypothetical protein AC631_00159 [Debaryomyces fabryi]CUM50190.1 unnamed protein product [Debaryomyces fabryi]
MTCMTSLKEEKRPLNPLNKIERLSDREKEHEINNENASGSANTACDLVSPERNDYEKHLQEVPKDQPTMIVSLPVPRKGVANSKDGNSDDVQRKSPAQKELNSVQRKKQIAEYNSLKLKEERQQRYKTRYGDGPAFLYGNCDPSRVSTSDEDGTPPSKRKKRVSFEF